jgi:ketosteroid isomerase-like protein
MKSLVLFTLSLSIGVLFGASLQKAGLHAPPQLRSEIIAKERQELEALKNGNVQEFADLMSEDAIFVDSKGTSSKAAMVASVRDLKLYEYAMADIRFVNVSPQSGVIAYKLTQKGREQGKDFADTVYVSALWAKRGGRWICLFTQESPAQ